MDSNKIQSKNRLERGSQATKERRGLQRYLPILTWLPDYSRGWLRPDFLAGLSRLGAGLSAVFGPSRQLVVAVSAATATMSAATVAPLAAAGSPEYAALTAGLALLAGLVSILAGLFKFGRIAAFFSESVLAGFVTGLALTIAIKQVPKLFGFE